MRLRVLAVGRDRGSLFGKASAEYARRIRHYIGFEVVETDASRKKDAVSALGEESARLLKIHGRGRRLLVLDLKGRQYSSEKLAELMSRFMQEGRDVDFVIGGDEGLEPDLRKRAEFSISLGHITLPHLLARLVLLEQIYRSLTIIRGEPYHK